MGLRRDRWAKVDRSFSISRPEDIRAVVGQKNKNNLSQRACNNLARSAGHAAPRALGSHRTAAAHRSARQDAVRGACFSCPRCGSGESLVSSPWPRLPAPGRSTIPADQCRPDRDRRTPLMTPEARFYDSAFGDSFSTTRSRRSPITGHRTIRVTKGSHLNRPTTWTELDQTSE